MAVKDEISAAWQRKMRLINEQNEKKWKSMAEFNGPRLRNDFENFADVVIGEIFEQ